MRVSALSDKKVGYHRCTLQAHGVVSTSLRCEFRMEEMYENDDAIMDE